MQPKRQMVRTFTIESRNTVSCERDTARVRIVQSSEPIVFVDGLTELYRVMGSLVYHEGEPLLNYLTRGFHKGLITLDEARRCAATVTPEQALRVWNHLADQVFRGA